jgi:hypothetical protein
VGIRVHKKLGYGITDFRTAPDDPDSEYPSMMPADPRWDYESYCEKWYPGRHPQERTIQDFRAWCELHANRLRELAATEGWGGGDPKHTRTNLFLLIEALKDQEKANRHWHTPDILFEWDNGHGLPGVVLFQCPVHPDWSRYDDIIDYYEEQGENRATPLKNTGIWPYDGGVRRYRLPTPEVATKIAETKTIGVYSCPRDKEKDPVDIDYLGGGDYNQLVGRWGANLDPVIQDPEVLQHLLEDWRPLVPVGILALMEYAGCFPDLGSDSMLNSLRPMVYVYWG